MAPDDREREQVRLIEVYLTDLWTPAARPPLEVVPPRVRRTCDRMEYDWLRRLDLADLRTRSYPHVLKAIREAA